MADPDLTADRRAEADRLEAALLDACRADIRRLAEVLAAKADHNLLGATEFEVRDRAHALGAKAIETALAGQPAAAWHTPGVGRGC